jgi:ribosome-associated toxin RatA of RatAB toxin-antitoxin module
MRAMPACPLRNRPGIASGRWGVVGLLAAAALSTAPAHAAADIHVVATAQEGAVEVTAQAVIRAPTALIWQTLTDYDHLSQFIPDITSSRVVSRQGPQSVVEQKGHCHLWFFSYPIRVTLASTERPFEGIDVRLVQGNLRKLQGGYRIGPRPDGSTELTWSGLIEPDTPLPSFIRTVLLRRAISEEFEGMVREIERRADLWSTRSALSR